MIELVVVGVLAFCALVVIGTLIAAASVVGWLLWLPFRLLGLVFRGFGLLIGLPLLFIGVVWLVRHSAGRAATS